MKNHPRTYPRILVALLLSATVVDTSQVSATAEEALAAPTLGLADSTIETFHDSDANPCGTTKVHIDSPMRAFEDQNNVIHVTVADPGARAWQWTGSVTGFTNNPTTAKLDCAPIMHGDTAPYDEEDDKRSFDQKTWIQGLYFSSPTVYAYGHEDYFGTRLNDPDCHDAGTADGKPYCWYAAIATWKASVPSSGTHLAFGRTATPPDHVAVYPHVRYPDDRTTPKAGWIGYGTPSNVVRGRKVDGTLDGYFYMFVYTNSGYGGQPTGVCLFRSADPTSPSSWRAWNGSTTVPAFTQKMVNPYTGSNASCAVVSPNTFGSSLRSVQWHKPSRHYIAVFRDDDAVRYATSPDLLSWSSPKTLLVSTSAQANYATIIDFDGGDWGDHNFDRVYSNGKTYLFYRKSIEHGHTRITRRQIEVTNYPADPPSSGNP